METTQQDEWAAWTNGMAELERPARPEGPFIENLLVELAGARSRALPALDADGRDLVLQRIGDALAGRV